MIRAAQVRAARKRYLQIAPVLNEQSRRRFAALEARALGRGRVSLMARITGLARSTIYHGFSDIRNNVAAAPGRIHGPGGGPVVGERRIRLRVQLCCRILRL
jgi:hypothetical protein